MNLNILYFPTDFNVLQGHCKTMIPAFEAVGESFSKVKDVVIGNMDADAHRDFASKYGIQGFPTLKYFSKGSETPEE